jgi:PleD family two-component response regulator
MALDLLTPKEALQSVLMGVIMVIYAAITRWWTHRRAALIKRPEFEKWKLEVIHRFDELTASFRSLVSLRALEQDNVMPRMKAASANYRVLLIEDNANDRLILRRVAPSIQFEEADTLEDGMRMARRNGYDVVLFDLGLPGYADLDALKKFRSEFSHMPLIVFSGQDNPRVVIEAAKIGCDGYLLKQVNLSGETVLLSIKNAIARKTI